MTTYRTIVELENGSHRIFRLQLEKVANFVALWRKVHTQLFNDLVTFTVASETLVMNRVKSAKFINEYTREEYLSLA